MLEKPAQFQIGDWCETYWVYTTDTYAVTVCLENYAFKYYEQNQVP